MFLIRIQENKYVRIMSLQENNEKEVMRKNDMILLHTSIHLTSS